MPRENTRAPDTPAAVSQSSERGTIAGFSGVAIDPGDRESTV